MTAYLLSLESRIVILAIAAWVVAYLLGRWSRQ